MHVLEHQRDRADDEAGEGLGEAAARLGEDRPELAARDVIHRCIEMEVEVMEVMEVVEVEVWGHQGTHPS